MAQVWLSPVVMFVAVRPVPRLIGSLGEFVFVPNPPVPFPSWPQKLFPQQVTVLLSRMAQVWLLSAVIAVAVRPVPRLMGAPGVVVSVLLPLPS
jgi:hypothetical protein